MDHLPVPELRLIRKGSGIVCYCLSDRGGLAELLPDPELTLVTVAVDDWNRDLSPWSAPACFREGEDFGGGADAFLGRLMSAIRLFEEREGLTEKNDVIAGYSLAGLFSLYALYRTDRFCGCACASGSLWFDGWIDYMRSNTLMVTAPRISLSVGTKEKRTRNPRLRQVESAIRTAEELLRNRGACVRFELFPGDHFTEPERRLSRGIRFAAGLREEDDA